jgi:hypothetical protein
MIAAGDRLVNEVLDLHIVIVNHALCTVNAIYNVPS